MVILARNRTSDNVNTPDSKDTGYIDSVHHRVLSNTPKGLSCPPFVKVSLPTAGVPSAGLTRYATFEYQGNEVRPNNEENDKTT